MVFNTAKVMSKGQITLPVDIRKSMGLSTGDRVALIYENDRVIMVNPAIYAMETLQREMAGAFEKAGINNEDDIMDLVREVREEDEKAQQLYEARLKEQRDQYARERGTILTIAKNALQMDMSIDQIVTATGLTYEEIENILA